MHISCEDQSKLDPKLKKCVFVGYTKGMKGFKLWDMVKKNMVISIYVVFYDHLMLKQSIATDMSAFEGESFNKKVIQMDVDPSLVCSSF